MENLKWVQLENSHTYPSIYEYFIDAAGKNFPTDSPQTTETPKTCTPNAMVSGSMYVQDHFMKASSSKEGRDPWKARCKPFYTQ